MTRTGDSTELLDDEERHADALHHLDEDAHPDKFWQYRGAPEFRIVQVNAQ